MTIYSTESSHIIFFLMMINRALQLLSVIIYRNFLDNTCIFQRPPQWISSSPSFTRE